MVPTAEICMLFTLTCVGIIQSLVVERLTTSTVSPQIPPSCKNESTPVNSPQLKPSNTSASSNEPSLALNITNCSLNSENATVKLTTQQSHLINPEDEAELPSQIRQTRADWEANTEPPLQDGGEFSNLQDEANSEPPPQDKDGETLGGESTNSQDEAKTKTDLLVSDMENVNPEPAQNEYVVESVAESELEENAEIGRLNDPHKLEVNTFIIGANEDDDFGCSDSRGPLRLISPNSRYFADSKHTYNYEHAKKICSDNALIIAELDGVADQRSIQQYFNSNHMNSQFSSHWDRYFIGMNDIRKEGKYVRADGKPITFQAYHVSQPDDHNMNEDCTTISKEMSAGPVGSSDDNCMNLYHVLCMFKPGTQCSDDSKETKENKKLEKKFGLHLLVNASERAYFVSNFQTTWEGALLYCKNHSMKVFNMDGVVNMGFFRTLVKWESNFIGGTFPIVQYWTSGKFKKTHMNAPVFWYNQHNLTESEERKTPKPYNFTFSGVFKWSTHKKVDPGGNYGYRRDICLSFGFDTRPDATPFVRNTNCDIPTYFVCYAQYESTDGFPKDRRRRKRRHIHQ